MKIDKRVYLSFSITLLLGLLFSVIVNIACTTKENNINRLPTPATNEMLNFTDELGRNVTLPKKPQRIISLAPNITEILFALGLDEQIVGVTSFCNYPAQTQKITKIGDTLHPNLETILSLHPDLILISTASQLEELMRKLEELKIPVFVLKPSSLEKTLATIETVGLITHREVAAKRLVDQLKARLENVKVRVAEKGRPKVFFVVGTEPLITAGRDAFITDMINIAGGDSISSDVAAEWPTFSMETVIARAPEIILVPGGDHGEAGEKPNLPAAIEGTPAIKNNRTYRINGDLILRPGPRIIDGLEQMAKLFHPEAF